MQVSSTKLFLVFLVQLWDNSLGLKKQDNFFVHGQKIAISKEDSVLSMTSNSNIIYYLQYPKGQGSQYYHPPQHLH